MADGVWVGWVVLMVGVLVAGCGKDEDPRFATPAATFATYRRAIAERDWELLWACYSQGFRDHFSGGREQWQARWAGKASRVLQAETEREIRQERILGEGVAYLLFAEGTLPPGVRDPFFYLVWEEGGWHLTSHLDGVFHARLEKAVRSGAFKLPVQP